MTEAQFDFTVTYMAQCLATGERGEVAAAFVEKCDEAVDNSMHKSMLEHAAK